MGERQGYQNLVTRTHNELDLTRQDEVESFFAEEKPEYVFLAAAKVGGIAANAEALADFMYDNMILEMNVIHSARRNGCRKVEFLGPAAGKKRLHQIQTKLHDVRSDQRQGVFQGLVLSSATIIDITDISFRSLSY